VHIGQRQCEELRTTYQAKNESWYEAFVPLFDMADERKAAEKLADEVLRDVRFIASQRDAFVVDSGYTDMPDKVVLHDLDNRYLPQGVPNQMNVNTPLQGGEAAVTYYKGSEDACKLVRARVGATGPIPAGYPQEFKEGEFAGCYREEHRDGTYFMVWHRW